MPSGKSNQGNPQAFEITRDKLWNSANLRELRIEVTHDCPLQCLHCSACSSTDNPLQLDSERVIDVIDEFVAMGGKKIVITGGEPLVYADLMKIVAAAKNAGVRPVLFTSGIARDGKERRCISSEEIMQLKPFLSGVVFSMYSTSHEKHEQITQVKNSLTMVFNAVRLAASYEIPTDIHFVPMKINLKDLAGISDFGYKLGVRRVRILRFVPHGRGEEYKGDLLPSVDDYRVFAQTVEIARSRYPHLIDVGAAFNALIPSVSSTCSAATGKIVVTADGFVAPCDGFKNFNNSNSAWSIHTKSLRDIYVNSPFLCQVRVARNGQTRDKSNSQSSFDTSGCMAQKSLASGFITKSGIDPCISDSRRIEACAITP